MLLFDCTQFLISNLQFLLNNAEPENGTTQVGIYDDLQYCSSVQFNQEQISRKEPTPQMFNVYQNFSRPDRELLKVTLDCIACIRSKIHYDQIL